MDSDDLTRPCSRCHKEKPRKDLQWSYDCQGIPYRLVCPECMDEIDKVGYDGQYYDEKDERIDEDY